MEYVEWAIGSSVCGGMQFWLVSRLFDTRSFALAASKRVQRDGFHNWCFAIYCRNKCYNGPLYRLLLRYILVTQMGVYDLDVMCRKACEVKLEQCVFSIYSDIAFYFIFKQMITFEVKGEIELQKAPYSSVRDEPPCCIDGNCDIQTVVDAEQQN